MEKRKEKKPKELHSHPSSMIKTRHPVLIGGAGHPRLCFIFIFASYPQDKKNGYFKTNVRSKRCKLNRGCWQCAQSSQGEGNPTGSGMLHADVEGVPGDRRMIGLGGV